MKTKKKFIDLVSPKLSFLEEIEEVNQVSFKDILDFMNAKEHKCSNGKIFECSILETIIPDCTVGIIVTTLDRDIPPIRGKNSKIFSPVNINPSTQGLAFGNVFIYDKNRNILLYEINKNGCFLNQFKEFILAKWKENTSDESTEEDRVKFNLQYSTVLRKEEYTRMLQMNYYKRITVVLYNPSELTNCFNDNDLSLEESLLKYQIDAGKNNNANTIKLEQITLGKKLNPLGLSHSLTTGIVDALKVSIADKGYRKNIDTIEVEGYCSDTEGSRGRLKQIDLMADTFDEFFKIPDIQIQIDVQECARKKGIEELYIKLLPEIKSIIGY